ncbi:hypothetical protein AB5N19_09527 [Seiridium cardinale]
MPPPPSNDALFKKRAPTPTSRFLERYDFAVSQHQYKHSGSYTTEKLLQHLKSYTIKSRCILEISFIETLTEYNASQVLGSSASTDTTKEQRLSKDDSLEPRDGGGGSRPDSRCTLPIDASAKKCIDTSKDATGHRQSEVLVSQTTSTSRDGEARGGDLVDEASPDDKNEGPNMTPDKNTFDSSSAEFTTGYDTVGRKSIKTPGREVGSSKLSR